MVPWRENEMKDFVQAPPFDTNREHLKKSGNSPGIGAPSPLLVLLRYHGELPRILVEFQGPLPVALGAGDGLLVDGAAVSLLVRLPGVMLLVHVEVALRLVGLHGAADLVRDVRDRSRPLAPPAGQPDHGLSPAEWTPKPIIPRFHPPERFKKGTQGIISW